MTIPSRAEDDWPVLARHRGTRQEVAHGCDRSISLPSCGDAHYNGRSKQTKGASMSTIADIPAEVRRNFQAARLKARRTGRPFPWTLQTWVSAAEGGVSGPRVMAPVAVRTAAEEPKYGSRKRRLVALKTW